MDDPVIGLDIRLDHPGVVHGHAATLATDGNGTIASRLQGADMGALGGDLRGRDGASHDMIAENGDKLVLVLGAGRDLRRSKGGPDQIRSHQNPSQPAAWHDSPGAGRWRGRPCLDRRDDGGARCGDGDEVVRGRSRDTRAHPSRAEGSARLIGNRQRSSDACSVGGRLA